ncbi:hypothetical protein Cni_G10722 [Canna indica]|uniref:Uncharacterized protein n=1 Tax=Canna indica TaxID=4628 RepID=A0AAQ3K4R9_9LILI|nr:hypothetical protein Cni_G10722 [Canna indica]
MPPQLLTYEEDGEERRGGESTAHVEKVTFCHQSSVVSKEKCLFPRGIRNGSLQSQEVSRCSSFTSLPHRKPWPSSKANCLLSSPSDDVQAKAFKIGVIDWGLLQRWKYHQICLAQGRSGKQHEYDAENGQKLKIDALEQKLCHFKEEEPDLKAMCADVPLSVVNYSSAHVGRPRNAEKLRDYPHNISFVGNSKHLCHDSDSIWDPQQETSQGRRNSFESYFDDGTMMARDHNSTSLCPLEKDKVIKESGLANSFISASASVIDEPDAFQQESQVPTKQSNCRFRNQKQCSESISMQLGQGEGKTSTETGRRSVNHHVGPKWMMTRSASLKEGVDGNKDTSSEKGRRSRSPLRRMFDPFLKPKNNVQSSGPIAASPGRNSYELNEELTSFNSSDMRFVFTCATEDTFDANRESFHSDEHDAQTRRAVLQLAWRKGVPLFMFSSSDDAILAATVRKQSVPDNDELECIYTMFSIHGYKKKKSKKNQLVSDVIGRMNVSMLRNHEPQNHNVTREFVLLGVEPTTPTLTTHEPTDLSLEHSPDKDSSNSDAYKMLVILPSGMHASTNDVKPSPLIQRWSSGGTCDCGGWDEGCNLTILSNTFQESNSPESIQDDQKREFELFLQGGSRTNDHLCRMVSVKEGPHRVEFGISISRLQAFAICLAALHFGDSANLSANPERLLEHKGSTKSYLPLYCPPLSLVGRA